MNLKEQIREDFISAFKQKDNIKSSVLKMLQSEIRNAEIEKRAGIAKAGEPDIEDKSKLADDEVIKVISKEAKKRKEAIQAYKSGGREDLLEKELAELKIIEEFLPAQLSDEEIEKEVAAVIEQIGATGMKDLGRVMGEAMKKLKGKADGKKVQAIVRSKLA